MVLLEYVLTAIVKKKKCILNKGLSVFKMKFCCKWGQSKRNLLVTATTVVLGPLSRGGQPQNLLIHTDQEEWQLSSLILFYLGVDMNVSGDIPKQFCRIDGKGK